MDLNRIKQVGIAAATAGARVLRDKFGKLRSIRKKGAIDLVTEADISSEKAIIETISEAFPDHAILAEENGSRAGTGGLWIIDPLDGTTNFAHNLPIFCVSIAFAAHDDILAGFVLAPVLGELFVGIRDMGAQRNGDPIEVSKTETLADSLLVTGFPYDHQNHLRALDGTFRQMFVRHSGCQAVGFGGIGSMLCGQRPLRRLLGTAFKNHGTRQPDS
jgi:myo-inositol-1(or 4)-monophosphatase